MVLERTKAPAIEYMDGVLDGSIPACRFVKQAVERHKVDLIAGEKRGLWFDEVAAQHAIDFFGFLKHSKGEWAGQTFVLAPWQQFILWVLFGWKRADRLRRFRTGYIEVSRKNGKSSALAGIGLYLLVADGEPGSEVYSAAVKRDQARITHSEAVRMVQGSPLLRSRIKVFKDNLNIEGTASKYEPLGADADSTDGLNVHGALIDELHAHKTRAMVDVLKTATGARRQPLQVEITTAGTERQSVCYEHHEYSEKVLNGTIEDDTWFAYIATIDEGDAWDDPVSWQKANPNYGISVKPDDLERKVREAKQSPAALNAFLRLHLDVWTQQITRWIDPDLWRENAGEPIDETALEGQTCYGGLDLGSVSDITAWEMTFPSDTDNDEVKVISRFWCPEERLYDSSNRYREQYQAWAREGWLTTTPGNATDYDFIIATVIEDARRFNLLEMNIDYLFQGQQVAAKLEEAGIKVFGMRQGHTSFALPMKEFERRLLKRKILHGGNPVLAWMADNVAVRQDPAGNLKPDKDNSQGKIDGIVALVMAIDRAMRNEGGSVYSERGMLFL